MKPFFYKTRQTIGESAASSLKTFYEMVISSPYDVQFYGDENVGCFQLYFFQLFNDSIITVHTNGEIDINFENIRGSENFVLFGETLFKELNSKM